MTAFIASLIFVVLAEVGDKTQPATIALAVEYNKHGHPRMDGHDHKEPGWNG